MSFVTKLLSWFGMGEVQLELQVVSDLHMEQAMHEYETLNIEPQADYLVLAGDIGRATEDEHAVAYFGFLLRHCKKFKKVFLISGNNDPKGNTDKNGINTGLAALRNFAEQKVLEGRLVFMENDRYDFDDDGYAVTMLGSTLWARHRHVGYGLVSDLTTVGVHDIADIGGWSNSQNNHIHDQSMRFLRKSIRQIRREKRTKDHKIIVLTHHTPTIFKSSLPGTNGQEAESGSRADSKWSNFQTDILGGEGMEGLQKGDVWIFGHTHFSCDFYQDEDVIQIREAGTEMMLKHWKGRKMGHNGI
jgi:predicted phosphodiesterase